MILDEKDISDLDIDGHWVFGLRDFVRYSDLDAYGHVNNKAYHMWFENLRVLYLSALGYDFSRKVGDLPLVRAANVQFDRQMFLGQSYISLIRCAKLGRSSFTLDKVIWADGAICARGSTTMVMLDVTGTRTVPIAQPTREAMLKRDRGAQ